MTSKTQTIEIDDATATTLRVQAAAHGLSIAELVAGLTALATNAVALDSEDISELDRHWTAIQAGEQTTPHNDVANWLGTWGTSDFKSWRNR